MDRDEILQNSRLAERLHCEGKKKEEGELLQEDLGPRASHLSLAILSKAPGKLGGCRKSKGLPIFGWSFESL